MSDQIKVETIEPQPVLSVVKKGPTTEISKLMGQALTEVLNYIANENLKAEGPPFARYLSVGDEVEFEAGLPVNSDIEGNDRVKNSELPGGEVVSLLHIGSYDQLDTAHQMLKTWIKEQGREENGAPWEVYITDPEEEKDSAKWETLVRWPIK